MGKYKEILNKEIEIFKKKFTGDIFHNPYDFNLSRMFPERYLDSLSILELMQLGFNSDNIYKNCLRSKESKENYKSNILKEYHFECKSYETEIDDYIKEIEKFTKKISKSKKLAIKFANELGIWNKDGSLTEHYKQNYEQDEIDGNTIRYIENK